MLAAYDSPSKRAELKQLVADQDAATAHAEYEQRIRESEERAARDPNAQALFAKAKQQAKADREKMLADLRVEANLDIEADTEASRRDGFRSSLTPCARCHTPAMRMHWLEPLPIPSACGATPAACCAARSAATTATKQSR